MKRIWLSVLVVAPLIFAGACSSDDVQAIIDDLTPPQGMIDELDCLTAGLDDAGWSIDALFAVIEAIDEGVNPLEDPEFATYDCETREFDAGFDSDEPQNGVLDVFVDGTIAEVGNTVMCDGLDLGEQFTATWDLSIGEGQTPVATGSGTFTVAWTTADNVMVAPGGATINRADGCVFRITSIGLNINPNLPESYPSGTIEFDTSGGVLVGLLTLRGSELADVSLVYQGKTYNFKINLETGDPVFN